MQAKSKRTHLFYYFSQDTRIINLVFLLFFSYQDNGFNITDGVPLMFLKAVASTKGGLNISCSIKSKAAIIVKLATAFEVTAIDFMVHT